MPAGAQLGEESDDALLRCIERDRDEHALELLVRRYAGTATGYLRNRFDGVLREPERDQAVNDAFYNIWRFANRFDPAKGSFGGWFIAIVHRAARSILRAEKDWAARELEIDPADHREDEPSDGDPAVTRTGRDNARNHREGTGRLRADGGPGGCCRRWRGRRSRSRRSIRQDYGERSHGTLVSPEKASRNGSEAREAATPA